MPRLSAGLLTSRPTQKPSEERARQKRQSQTTCSLSSDYPASLSLPPGFTFTLQITRSIRIGD